MNEAKDKRERLSQKVVRCGVWVFGFRIVDRFFNLARTIILARLLLPSDFGLLGIVLLTTSALGTFSQTGFDAALIQKKENINEYLNTAWVVSAFRGMILFVIIFFAAPWVAVFFKTPNALPILRIMGISMLLAGFVNIGVIYFPKELDFRKQFIYVLSGTIVDTGIAIPLAFILRNVWALVYPALAGVIVRLFVSYWIHPYRPRFRFDLAKARGLFGFGKWIFGSSILLFLITQGDDIFLGRLLGVAALGFYQMAYRISNMPATEITHVISRVTFPAYSKLQDNLPKLREVYLKVLQLVALLSFPIAGFILVLAPDFTKIFLGEKWLPMVPAMQILVFAGLFRSILSVSGYVFLGIGMPKVETILEIIRLIVLAALIYPLTIRWGISGTSAVVLLSTLVASIGFIVMTMKLIKCRVKDFARTMAPPLISTIVVVLSIFALTNNKEMTGIPAFVLFLCSGILAYIFLVHFFYKHFGYKMDWILKEALQVFRGSAYRS